MTGEVRVACCQVEPVVLDRERTLDKLAATAAAAARDFPLRSRLDGLDLLGRGGSAILAPDGSYLAGPLYGEEGILIADLEPARLLEERQRFDPAGHYHRPDVLRLDVVVP